MAKKSLAATAKAATLVFTTKADAAKLTDAEVRLAIKSLREVLLDRQRQRAAAKYLKAHPECRP
jgi:hypothetical protein